MAYDEVLADRLRDLFVQEQIETEEKKMFGGLGFMIRDYMCVGITGEDLMARVGPDYYETALTQPHARPMDFTKKPLKGYVYVSPQGLDSEDALKDWVDRCVAFIHSLPAKSPATKKTKPRAKK